MIIIIRTFVVAINHPEQINHIHAIILNHVDTESSRASIRNIIQFDKTVRQLFVVKRDIHRVVPNTPILLNVCLHKLITRIGIRDITLGDKLG